MDKIHELDKKIWISKRIVNTRQLLQERHHQLAKENVKLNVDIDEILGENDQLLLDELDKFVSRNEREVKPFFLFNSTDEKALIHEQRCLLSTYQLQYNHAQKIISDRAYKVSYLSKLNTTRRELLMRHLALINRSNANPDDDRPLSMNLQPGLAAILFIQIWPQPCKSRKVRIEKEVLFRSDQCLTKLRNQFKCQRDYGVPMDLSENPESADRIFRGELFKSAFFLIGDTFYNDMRDPNNLDLSASIIDWSAKEVVVVGDDGKNVKVKRGLGPFKSVKMEEHSFDDLNFRLGCPYLYLHQGDCEHLFTISDIKYMPLDDKLAEIKFPFVTAASIGKKTDYLKCYMCKNRPPHWYTRNNDRLPVDPYFFCENCFYSFNYDSDRNKVGKFQAYLYTSAYGIPDSAVIGLGK